MAQRILAIDIGTSGVLLAEFQPDKGGVLQLLNYASAPLDIEPHDEDSRSKFIASTIKKLMADSKIKPGPAIIAVAGQAVFSKYIQLPEVEPTQLTKIIGFEAQDNLPFSIDEVVWDYQLIGGSDGKFDVLLVAIKQEIISDITTSVSNAGIDVDIVDVAPMAIFNAVRHNYGEMEGCTLVLDMGSRTTDLIFIEGDRIYNRSIPVAGNAITQQIARELSVPFSEAEQVKLQHAMVSFGGNVEGSGDEVTKLVSKCTRSVMTKMHAEINRSINFYRGQQSGTEPARILLTGGSSTIPYLDTFLNEKLNIPVEFLNPFQNVVVGPGLDEGAVSRDVHKLSEVVGLGLRRTVECPIELNLMPEKVAREKSFRKKQPFFLASAVALLIGLAALAFYYVKVNGHVQEDLKRVQAERSELEDWKNRLSELNAELASMDRDAAELAGVSRVRSRWPRILSSIRRSVPQGLYITNIEPEIEVPSLRDRGTVGRPDPNADPEKEKEKDFYGIRHVLVRGVGFTDIQSNRTAPGNFLSALRDESLFTTNTTEITYSTNFNKPNPRKPTGDFYVSFEIKAVLEEPIEL